MSLQKIAGFALCLVALVVMGCDSGSSGVDAEDPDKAIMSSSRDDDRPPLPPPPGGVVVNHEDAAPSQWGSDEYDLQTGEDIDTGEDRTPVLEADTLSLTVSYGGGCREHDFTLVAAMIADDECDLSPVVLDVFLAHDDHDDPCEAYPTVTYDFDLTPIKEMYRDTCGEDAGAVDLRLRDVGGNLLYEDDLIYAVGEP